MRKQLMRDPSTLDSGGMEYGSLEDTLKFFCFLRGGSRQAQAHDTIGIFKREKGKIVVTIDFERRNALSHHQATIIHAMERYSTKTEKTDSGIIIHMQ
jgi:hypothetical protein